MVPGREGIEGAMDEQNVIDIDMKGAPACGRCFMLVARYAPQVIASSGTYPSECFVAWYFGRYRKRPRLIGGNYGERHRLLVRVRVSTAEYTSRLVNRMVRDSHSR